MIVKNNKEYRNLTEQVLENQKNIEDILQGTATLSEFGLKIIYLSEDGTTPTDPPPLEPGDDTNFGYSWLVRLNPGTPDLPIYGIWVWTRLDFEIEVGWVDLGRFPKPGPIGLTGPVGPKGDTGTILKWLVGDTIPGASIGINGEMYLQTTNSNVYQKVGTSWSLITNIQGATGPEGKKGETGATGSKGDKGDKGDQGDTGLTGAIGPKGNDGVSLEIQDGIFSAINPLPQFSTTSAGQGFIYLDNGGYYDLYIHAHNGTDWLIVDNWGGSGLGDILITNNIYVDNGRVDSYSEDGSINKPFRSIGTAISYATTIMPATPNRLTIMISNTGIYNENISLPQRVDLRGKNATVVGTITFIDGSVEISRHYASSSEQTLVTKTGINTGYFSAELSDGRGLSGFFNNNVNCTNNVDGSILYYSVKKVIVSSGNGSAGFMDTSSGTGHTHITCEDIYLSDSSVGINATNVNSHIVMECQHLLPINGATNTIGFRITNQDGKIIATVGELVAATAWTLIIPNTGKGLTLNCLQITGTRSGSVNLTASDNEVVHINTNTPLQSILITASSGTRRVMNANVSGTISGTAELYLVNCTGSVTVSGNTAKLYVSNSPSLTISGKTASNWYNIYVDSRAEWDALTSAVITLGSNYTRDQVIKSGMPAIQAGDQITAVIGVTRVGQWDVSTYHTARAIEASISFNAFIETDYGVNTNNHPVSVQYTISSGNIYIQIIKPAISTSEATIKNVKYERFL